MTFCMSYYLWNEQYFFPSDRNISHGLFTTISAFTRLHSPFTIFNSNGSYWIQKLQSNYLKFQIATSVNQNCELSLANVLQLYSRVQYLSSIHLWLTALTYRVSPKKVTFWIACLTGQISFFFNIHAHSMRKIMIWPEVDQWNKQFRKSFSWDILFVVPLSHLCSFITAPRSLNLPQKFNVWPLCGLRIIISG